MKKLDLRRTAALIALAAGSMGFTSPAFALFGEKPAAPITVPKASDLAASSNLASQFLMLGVARAGQRLVACGEYGHILISDDEGKNWRQAKTVPSKVTLTAIVFMNDKDGWAVGHDTTVLHTVDGGETWERQFGGTDSDNALLTVVFMDAKRGLAMGAFNYTIETADGGKTWKQRKLVQAQAKTPPPAPASTPAPAAPPAAGGNADSLQAEADKEAEARAKESGIGSAYAVSDEDDAHLNAAFTGPGDAVYVAAEAGKFYRSSDGGKTFELIKTPYVGSYWGGTVLGDGTLLLAGMRGNIWRSIDKGTTWTKAATVSADQSLASLVQTPDGMIVSVGLSGGLLVSKDGGKSFGVKYRDDRKGMNSVIATADGRILVFGESGIHDVTSEIGGVPAPLPAPEPAAVPPAAAASTP